MRRRSAEARVLAEIQWHLSLPDELAHKWRDLPFKRSAVYLGIPIGAAVTTYDIFRNTLAKFERCLARWRAAPFSVFFRLYVANVFLLSLFGHIEQFFPLPRQYISRIRVRLVCFILKLNVCRYQLVSAFKDLGLKWEAVQFHNRGLCARACAWTLVQSLPRRWVRSIISLPLSTPILLPACIHGQRACIEWEFRCRRSPSAVLQELIDASTAADPSRHARKRLQKTLTAELRQSFFADVPYLMSRLSRFGPPGPQLEILRRLKDVLRRQPPRVITACFLFSMGSAPTDGTKYVPSVPSAPTTSPSLRSWALVRIRWNIITNVPSCLHR